LLAHPRPTERHNRRRQTFETDAVLTSRQLTSPTDASWPGVPSPGVRMEDGCVGAAPGPISRRSPAAKERNSPGSAFSARSNGQEWHASGTREVGQPTRNSHLPGALMVETMGIEPTIPCFRSRTETFEFPLFIGHTLGNDPDQIVPRPPFSTLVSPCYWHADGTENSSIRYHRRVDRSPNAFRVRRPTRR